MNKIITGAYIIVICCFISCASKEPEYDSTLMNTDTSKPGTKTPDSQDFLKQDTTLKDSGKVVMPTSTESIVNQASPTTVASGMNPPHGQPNHRCDISVGAPLNSPVTKAATQPVTQPVTTTVTTPAQKATAKTVTPPGMNPPHGEPGHRCDIAVGASLNLPVTKPASQTGAPVPVTEPVIILPRKDSGS